MPQSRRRTARADPGAPVLGRGGGRSRPGARGSNATRAAQLGEHGPQPEADGPLDSAFDLVLAGDFSAAKGGAQAAAEQARAAGQPDRASEAGLVWQIADAFAQVAAAMEEERFEAAKGLAATAAQRSRALQASGAVDAADLDLAIESAGKSWTLAKKAADAAAKAGGGRGAPMVDQHQLPHERNWAFCGVATLIMMLRANGIAQGSSTADLNGLADRVYHTGVGTSGADMAGVLRDRGLKDSTYTTTGTTGTLLESLDAGQPVPFGVTRVEGVVTKLEGGASQRYAHRRVGDTHSRAFPGSGHWVLVVGYEGKAERPTAFVVNDPDLGGELRCTPAQLDRMGEGSGSFWMVHQ